MNFGTLTIVDGHYQPETHHDLEHRRGLVRMGGALVPLPAPQGRPHGTTFVVEANYSAKAYSLESGKSPYATNVSANYSKTYKRLASGGNPLKDAKNFVATLAGCEEAHKLRKRVIALSRIKKTIYGETFRFPLEGQ